VLSDPFPFWALLKELFQLSTLVHFIHRFVQARKATFLTHRPTGFWKKGSTSPLFKILSHNSIPCSAFKAVQGVWQTKADHANKAGAQPSSWRNSLAVALLTPLQADCLYASSLRNTSGSFVRRTASIMITKKLKACFQRGLPAHKGIQADHTQQTWSGDTQAGKIGN